MKKKKEIKRIFKIKIFFYSAVFFALCMVSSCAAPTVNDDGKLQSEIAKKLYEHSELSKINIVVIDGIVNLSGDVADESLKIKAESLAKIEGVRDVKNNISVIVQNQSEQITNTNSNINSESELTTQNNDIENLSWDERAYNFIHEEYLKPRLVTCEDSHFLLVGKTLLYETKKMPEIRIAGEVIPEDVLSEADRLNNKKPLPERWKGRVWIKIVSPWRSYDGTKWNAWRNDSADTRSKMVESAVENKWVVYDGKYGKWSVDEGYYNNEPIYERMGEYKCVGSDIDVASIPGGPE